MHYLVLFILQKLFFVTIQRYSFIERNHYLCVAKEMRPWSQHLINIEVFGYLPRTFNWIDARKRRETSVFRKALDFVHLYKFVTIFENYSCIACLASAGLNREEKYFHQTQKEKTKILFIFFPLFFFSRREKYFNGNEWKQLNNKSAFIYNSSRLRRIACCCIYKI